MEKSHQNFPNLAKKLPRPLASACVLVFPCILFLFLISGLTRTSLLATSTELSFERHIRPILKANCFHCHGEGESLKGGVDLRLRRLMLTNSVSGAVLVPGIASKSVIYQVLASGEMPKGDKKLTTEELRKIQVWIDQGAKTLRPEPLQIHKFVITEEERDFWSFKPIKQLAPPNTLPSKPRGSPIDDWLAVSLENVGIEFAATADRRTLIRRVTFDLLGLAPTPEEVHRFETDAAPGAYSRLVDRLLSNPHYGQRWARHWLDVAGYADSNGASENDSERPWVWRYRDYVIRVFNSDKPFNRFIEEQLAGDELIENPTQPTSEDDREALVATGFLRLAPDPTGDSPPDPNVAKNQVIADTLQIVSSSLLGITLHCAQCHDHRYDPVPQSDYYRLRAIFEPAFNTPQWKSPSQRLVSLVTQESRLESECTEHLAKTVDSEAQSLHDQLIEKFVQKQLELVPEKDRSGVLSARRTEASKRTESDKNLLRIYPTFQDHIILGEVDQEGAKKVEAIRKRATEVRKWKPEEPMIHCLVEDPSAKPDTFLFHRGDHLQPRSKVAPGFLTVLESGRAFNSTVPFDHFLTNAVKSSQRAMATSGRRLAFARYLTSESNPLTPRVWVNRVWHHHFGSGLVTTLSDFGALGEKPTHPELLDWLASEFVQRGWSMKQLHRLIVTSKAYQQSIHNPKAQQIDPDNRLLGRMRPRRMDAEALRDSLIQLGGRINESMYGPPVPVAVTPQGQFVVGSQNKDGNGFSAGVSDLGGAEFRRSIFVQSKRSMPVGVLETFDAQVPSPNCEVRFSSTVASQSLMLLNDQFTIERSRDMAKRLVKSFPGDPRSQIAQAYWLTFATPPSTKELREGVEYLAAQLKTLLATFDSNPQKNIPKLPVKPQSSTQDGNQTSAYVQGEVEALATFCQVLIASNRFLYLD